LSFQLFKPPHLLIFLPSHLLFSDFRIPTSAFLNSHLLFSDFRIPTSDFLNSHPPSTPPPQLLIFWSSDLLGPSDLCLPSSVLCHL